MARVLGQLDGISSLLREFVLVVVERGVIVISILVALTSLGVSLAPVLVLFGGAVSF